MFDEFTYQCYDCESAEGYETLCPYAKEIDGEDVDVILCAKCYKQREWDI